MNIQELDAYNLADAVKFNDRLNPRLWDKSEHLKPEVRERLLLIAEDFKETLGIKDLDLKDITISGSNAAYTYTPNSDIDLHLVVNMPENPVYRELFDAKKFQYNETHNIKIGGFDVEVYVETADKTPITQGMYSVLNNEWIQVPKRVKSSVDDASTKNKFETIGHQIEAAIKSGDSKRLDAMARKVKRMRQTGLEAHGEFGPENLAFKMLRSQGVLQKLHDARAEAKSRELSLKEKAPAQPFVYGFKEDAGLTWDGVSPETCMFLDDEQSEPTDEEILKDFIDFCAKELKLEHMPRIKLRKDPQWPVTHKTFGRYINARHMLEVAWGQRHIMDVLRTVAHELTHKHQHERDGAAMGPDAGETGSKWENEANARAGILMRDYARLHPDFFALGQAERLHVDEAVGYIPTAAEKNDPRYKMAITQDVQPGAIGRAANAFKLNTDSQGHPQQARTDGLVERMMEQLAAFKRGELFESEQLAEVSMRPSTLKQFARSPEAEGIQAGFEAELIFRDTESDGSGDEDWEPDYDADERVYSVSDIIDFFSNDDYGYGLSSRERSNLEDKINDAYYEWYDEQMYREFKDEEQELVKEVWLDEKPMVERMHAMLVDGLDLTDADAERIIANGSKAPKFKKSDDQEIYAEENPDYELYLQAYEGAEEILDEDVESSISNQDKYYDQALENFRDNFQINDNSGFFSDQGWTRMSDIAEAFDLAWPVMSGSGSNGGGRSWDEIGDSLHDAVGMKTVVSSGYHSAKRKPDQWIVEPDSSLDPDDYTDFGLEIVSPPMPLAQALEKLDQVVNWANGPGNAYTNQSTGLHMGVSVPYKGGEVDYLKLVLFLGDEYVLEKFGRSANTYTRAAMKEIKSKAGSEHNAKAVMELLKNNLVELAERELVKGTGSGKYTSAHKQGKYIEFRSAGGDWLAKADEEIGVLENTMMRYAYAMYLAGRPDLERKEYAKKLYKLVSPEGDNSIMSLFSQYASGTIDKEQLKKQWAEKTLEKDEPGATEKGEWVLVDKRNNTVIPGAEYHGMTKNEVYRRAKEKYGEYITQATFDKTYGVEPMYTGRWEVYRDDHGKIEPLEIVDAETRGQAVDQVYDRYTGVIPFKVRPYHGDKETGPEKELSPRAKLAKRIVQKPKEQPQQQQEPARTGIERSNWNLKNRNTGETVYRINNMNRDEAAQYALNWLRQQGANSSDYQILPVDQPTGTPAEQLPAQQQTQQATAPNGVPMWEIYQRDNGHVVHTFADHNQQAAWGQAQTWLRGVGAEDPSLFSVRPKMES